MNSDLCIRKTSYCQHCYEELTDKTIDAEAKDRLVADRINGKRLNNNNLICKTCSAELDGDSEVREVEEFERERGNWIDYEEKN